MILLRRPDSANRLEPTDLQTLLAHCAAIQADPGIHAVVVAAEGRSFCAGFDLNALAANETAARGRHSGERAFEQMTNALADLRPIVIAAIDGAVVGGATDIVFATDLRIGTARATFQMPAARIGVPLYASALQRYVSRLGVDTAKRLIFMGQRLNSEDMQRLAILTEVVDEGGATTRALSLATELASLPPEPLAAMKRALNAAAANPVSDDIRTALDMAYDPAEIARRVATAKAARVKS
jgi:enoyl-CoA hydratase